MVDDDPDCRTLLAAVLAREGYHLRTGEDGIQCVRAAKTQRPDLIILNYLMPRMDGLAALRQIKLNPVISYLKVVMYSAAADFNLFRKTALEGGALDCLHSPFEIKSLLSVVERNLRR